MIRPVILLAAMLLPAVAEASPFALGPAQVVGGITARVSTGTGSNLMAIGRYQVFVEDLAIHVGHGAYLWSLTPTPFANGLNYALDPLSLGATKDEQVEALLEAGLADLPAVAAALWAIVATPATDGYSVTTGPLIVYGAPAGFYADAAAYLGDVEDGSLQPLPNLQVTVYEPEGGAGTAFALVTDPPTPVPEPWSIALLAAGWLGVASMRRSVGGADA